jgi:hypothetical protein
MQRSDKGRQWVMYVFEDMEHNDGVEADDIIYIVNCSTQDFSIKRVTCDFNCALIRIDADRRPSIESQPC